MNEIKTALTWALTVLNKAPDARIETEILLAYVLRKNRAYLFTYPEQKLTAEQKAHYTQLVTKRGEGTPIAYLTGEREFWSLNLTVTPHTLIPRHETERLVELALELLPAQASLNILDLGTGSGTIALALASERPHWQITACDKSKEALEIAKANAKQLKLTNISFYESDWFSALPPSSYHAIVSNPPYIAPNDPHLQQGDVRFEPLSALISEENGLADIQKICTEGYNHLLANGLILLEHGYDQKNAIRAILNKLGYCKEDCWQDISGQDRVSGGWKPE
ncbi:peptide chain release factor N(5)-glutamine methyltransferase [Legionella sp. km772]|uniref:peptide chain release factor N(5)-glutamine methyltransferase n=1 Tax=Legionella sp. km772 TaxID=2498111 RepID=UPI000F8D8E61|nr:peptide chain release factor N(5)-glutamine methyltransferase [Legionella sp. km772]RUR11367.1 peptide chain release factor N(5)-glutamine methyltransferase [Legionella sp. km772]